MRFFEWEPNVMKCVWCMKSEFLNVIIRLWCCLVRQMWIISWRCWTKHSDVSVFLLWSIDNRHFFSAKLPLSWRACLEYGFWSITGFYIYRNHVSSDWRMEQYLTPFMLNYRNRESTVSIRRIDLWSLAGARAPVGDVVQGAVDSAWGHGQSRVSHLFCELFKWRINRAGLH